jgi:cytochrome c553
MGINASGMTEEDMRDVGDYFAAQELPQTPFELDPAKIDLGRQTADDLKCGSCNGSGYKGQDDVPRLAGQWWDYIVAELKNFLTGRRSNTGAEATDAMRKSRPADRDESRSLFRAIGISVR